MNVYSIIMAGGKGTRFWPISRNLKPKQVLKLAGEESMINKTVSRLKEVIDFKNVYIVTNKEQSKIIKEAIEYEEVKQNILIEPMARNTAACILYSVFKLYKNFGDGVVCIFPSDHYIEKEHTFKNVLKSAVEVAEKYDRLVTIGITPTYPATGYGYIKFNEGSKEQFEGLAYEVSEFKEKPEIRAARRYIDSKKYFWNSGMFVFKMSKILKSFERFLPLLYNNMCKMVHYMDTHEEEHMLHKTYQRIDNISIDYGVFERSDEVVVIPGNFGWNDIGSWESLGCICKSDENANIIKGKNVSIDSQNCVMYSEKQLISTVGLENMIVVSTEDAILVCSKERAQDVKHIVDLLKQKEYTSYL